MIDSRDGERAGVIDVFAGVAKTMRKRALLVITVPLVAGLAAFWVTADEPDQYRATASLLLRDRQLAELVSGYTPPYSDPAREAETNLSLLSSSAVANRVAAKLPSAAAAELSEDVSVTQGGGSDLVYIAASARSPEAAALIANTWASEYIAFRKEADRSQIVESIAVVDRRLADLSEDQAAGTEGTQLRDQRNRLEVVASLQTGNAELVDTAQPPSAPYAPRPLRAAILAGIAGLIVAILGALLIQRFDRHVGSAASMEEILRTRILGDIPSSRRLRWRPGAEDGAELAPREREAFRVLRTNLTYFSLDNGLDSVLVTSATPGEGKTTVAIHLARAFADSGARTLLLEADLRRPTLAARMKLGASPGLTSVLVGETSLERAIVRAPAAMESRGPNGGVLSSNLNGPSSVLDVVAAGGTPPNPADVLDSRAFKELFERLRQMYDIVVVDGPPVLGLSDTTPLSRLVSGTLVVARLGLATTTSQRSLERQLGLIGARVLGLAVNDSTASGADAYYAVAPEPARAAG